MKIRPDPTLANQPTHMVEWRCGDREPGPLVSVHYSRSWPMYGAQVLKKA